MNTNAVTLRQLRAFCAIADHLSFTIAANNLNLTQSALSGLLKELELQLDVRLVDRSTKSVSLSSVGEAFLPLARMVLSDLDNAIFNINNLKDLRQGIVRFSAPEILSCTIVPDLINSFKALYPSIDINFSDISIERVLSTVLSGENEIGILPSEMVDADLQLTHLMDAELWVAFSPENPIGGKRRICWRDLADQKVINPIRNFAENVLSQVPRGSHPGSVKTVRRANTALSMVRTGNGVTVVAEFGQKLAHGFDLIIRPLYEPVISRSVVAITRPNVTLSPASQKFMDHMINFTKTWALTNRLDAHREQ